MIVLEAREILFDVVSVSTGTPFLIRLFRQRVVLSIISDTAWRWDGSDRLKIT